VGTRRPAAEVQIAVVIVPMMVMMTVIVVMRVMVTGPVAVLAALDPGTVALTASAYRAHGFTSEPVNESPAVARRTLGVPGKARGCTEERA
jgi:hypothetical protein